MGRRRFRHRTAPCRSLTLLPNRQRKRCAQRRAYQVCGVGCVGVGVCGVGVCVCAGVCVRVQARALMSAQICRLASERPGAAMSRARPSGARATLAGPLLMNSQTGVVLSYSCACFSHHKQSRRYPTRSTLLCKTRRLLWRWPSSSRTWTTGCSWSLLSCGCRTFPSSCLPVSPTE